ATCWPARSGRWPRRCRRWPRPSTPRSTSAALFHRAAIRAPLAPEFPSEEAARRGRAYTVAGGDVLVVPRAGAWLACGTEMVPASGFLGSGGRYADSVRLARHVAPR